MQNVTVDMRQSIGNAERILAVDRQNLHIEI